MIMATKDDEKIRVKPDHTAPLPEQDRTNPQFSSNALVNEALTTKEIPREIQVTGEMPRELPQDLSTTATLDRPTVEEIQEADRRRQELEKPSRVQREGSSCLLYTSDAADE